MRLLVFGGSFNPLHLGHLMMAQEARVAFGYDAVALVPAYRPPHKTLDRDPGPEARLEMLNAAASDDESLRVDALEFERGGTSYTIDTIREFAGRDGIEGRPGLLIGEDQAAGFSSWFEPDAIAAECDIVIARRSAGFAIAFPWRHRELENIVVPISSSMVRSRIASGLPYRRFVPDAVWRLVEAKGWYRG